MKYHVPDMSCGHCKATIDRSLKDADAAARLEFDMENRVVTVESRLPSDKIRETLRAAGYEATPVQQPA